MKHFLLITFIRENYNTDPTEWNNEYLETIAKVLFLNLCVLTSLSFLSLIKNTYYNDIITLSLKLN